ncbi:uncharacterized protein [Nicotiana sylvestris]|uniref:uncharacterized protein isoform X1 n=1 Tax=Nicotiana sylvestris TaxID=4096 RepID=UPI00388CCE94
MMPEGYASNFGKKVDMEVGKLSHLKSHDCHVFMETLVPIAFCDLPERIWKLITKISLFFKNLCSSTLREENLHWMDQNIRVTSSKMENIFSCGFFDVMEHLLIHLVHEARLGGPVQCRWMYPFERIIGKCKTFVKQRNRIEGSICEAYLAKETAHFCSYYFESNVPCARNRPNRHTVDLRNDPLYPSMSIFNQPGRCSKDVRKRSLSDIEFKSATLHVLLNCPEVVPFFNHFMGQFGHDGVYTRFDTWFKQFVNDPNNGVNQFLKDISWGPGVEVTTMSKYTVNGYKFHTEDCSKHKNNNNSGVWVQGGDGNQDGDIDYYGVLKEIIELEYIGWPYKKLILFRCKCLTHIQQEVQEYTINTT